MFALSYNIGYLVENVASGEFGFSLILQSMEA